jgi:tRNA-splicing ligase RtcB (3'-phosphate/5'-hydroxy nucleic acid ligase)
MLVRPAATSQDDERGTAPDVRVFDSPDAPADPFALARLRDGLADADLAAPPVVLPDFHHKADKEMPSSIAVATRNTIRPALTSASVNCGMALVSLDVERPGAPAIADFYRRVRERYPYPATYRRDLTTDEVVRCAAEGARFSVDRFGVDPTELDAMEEGGRLEVESYGGAERVRRELPWSVQQLSRIRFGTIGPSNHFIELQEVEEVLDAEAAELLGLEVGQVTLQYHGGGGSLAGELGLLFSRRKRYPRPVRIQMAAQKPLYHLARARSLEEIKLRRALYFSDGCPPVEREGAEGERLMLANAMAMNYGFAFRLSTYASLRSLVRQSFGALECRLIVDSPHNSIYEEELDGGSALVHRHNTARAYPPSQMTGHPVFGRIGRPLLLPGTNRTSSYLCAPSEEVSASLHSICHGAGSIIKQFASRGLSEAHPHGRVTLRFDYSGAGPIEVEQLDDRGIDEALGILTKHRLVRPIVRLRPFAVLN